MERPSITRAGDSYIVLWEESQIGMLFERLSDRYYGTTAELILQRVHANGSEHLYGIVQVCLTNSRSMVETAQQISKHVEGADWESLLMVACTMVLEEFRKPEKPVYLDLVEAPIQTDFISRFMPMGQLTIVAADGGSGKSFLALGLATAIMTGQPLTTRLIPHDPVGVLYLDWETGWETHERRLTGICRGLGVPKPHIVYQRMARPLADEVVNVRRLVNEHKIGFVIIDSVLPATGAGTNETDGAVRIANAVRQIGEVTTLGLTHVAKASVDQKDGRFSPMGSVQFKNQARQVWTIRRVAEPDRDYMVMGFTHLKTNDGGYHAPFALKVHFGVDAIKFSLTDIMNHAALEGMAQLNDRISDILVNYGTLTVKEICEKLADGTNEGTVRDCLNDAANNSLFIRFGAKNKAIWGARSDSQA